MTTTQIAEQHGFRFSHDCSICKNRYKVFLHPELKNIEMKIRKADGYTKVIRGGKQIAFCNQHHLDRILNQLFPQTVTS